MARRDRAARTRWLSLLLGATATVALSAGALMGLPAAGGSWWVPHATIMADAPGVEPLAALSVARPSATNGTLDVGQSTTLNVSAAGGTPPYAYLWNGLPVGCPGSDAATLVCSPSSPGRAEISVNVTDAHGGRAASLPLNVTVNPRVTIADVTLSANSVPLGGNLTITVTASGGTGTLVYSYEGLPDGCDILDSPSLYCEPTTAGNYLIFVTVIDQVGESADASQDLVVTGHGSLNLSGPPPPLLNLAAYLPVIVVVAVVATVATAVLFLEKRREAPPR